MQSQTLCEKTLTLLENRPKGMTLLQIANDTGLTLYWLQSFLKNAKDSSKDFDPGVNKIVTLYNHLNDKKLKY